jgi:hypothetical protein
MWLMNSIRKVITELLNNLLDFLVLFASSKIPNHPLEPFLGVSTSISSNRGNNSLKSADFSFVIKLVI